MDIKVEEVAKRKELEDKYGQVWNTTELQEDFTVSGFCDYTHKWMSRVLNYGMNKRKKERENKEIT